MLLFIVGKSGWCYCGLCCCSLWVSQAGVIVDCTCCCLLWISQTGVIVDCVVVNSGYVRLVLLWAVLLFIVDKSGWCHCGLCYC